jgi:hypothetical protein
MSRTGPRELRLIYSHRKNQKAAARKVRATSPALKLIVSEMSSTCNAGVRRLM